MHTPEQIETWASDADMECRAESLYIGTAEDLTRFAALVAQHERERCIAAVEGERLMEPTAHGDDKAYERALDDAIAAIRNSDGG